MHKSLIIALFLGSSEANLFRRHHYNEQHAPKEGEHKWNHHQWTYHPEHNEEQKPEHHKQHHFNPFSSLGFHQPTNQTQHHHKAWNPLKTFKDEFKNYSKWGQITFVDDKGVEIDAKKEFYNAPKSKQTNHWLKWYEEKTGKYLAYEAAAKKFMLEDEYENRDKCPIMSFLTSESQIDAKMNEPQDPESIFYVEEPEESSAVPTAMFHGFGDFCLQPGDIQFNEMLRRGTGAAVKCIEVGIPSIGSIIGNIEEIARASCQKIANDKTFHGEFNVIGLSQGGLLARYIAEECDMPGKVRNIVTLGGPHMGVAAVPHCFEGVACDLVNMVAKKLVYTSLAQNWIVPAGYFRDVNDMAVYEKDSVFLPALNNEKSTTDYSNLRESKFSDINAGLFGMFSEDTMIYPKETAWFQGLDKQGKVEKLEDSDFYKNDNIGLKTLNEAGKIKFDKIDGDHLQFTTTYIKETVIPFLKQ